MARVLVVEDEERYREVVCRYLSLRGHEVRDTDDGQEAIALGLEHRPEVLVADWMLRHSVHGLHVAEALRVADPSLHTVVVTGFPASDVTIDRGRVGVAEILEKPFDVEALDGAVRRAAGAGAGAEQEEVIGVLLADEEGTIRHGNRSARTLLAEIADGEPERLSDFLPAETLRALVHDGERWVRAEPGGAAQPLWLRARRLHPGGPFVILLCRVSQEWRREDPRVRMLLGLPLGGAGGPFREMMMLVDDSASVRDTFVKQLESRGCPARAADSHAAAVDAFRADPRIQVVILDWAMPGEDLRNTVAQLREIRPQVRLVGTSGEDRSREFRELGIDEFLLKPWTVAGELSSLLSAETPAARGPSPRE